MYQGIRLLDISGNDFGVDASIELPSKCPVCNHAMKPHLLYAASWEQRIGVAFLCMMCKNAFIAQYDEITQSSRAITNMLTRSLLGSGPKIYRPLEALPTEAFSDRITKLSAMFVEIYHQAEQAEYFGLKLIAGPGYRKALEFLIKDYACHINPSAAEAIQKKTLVSVIDGYLNNVRLKELAKRAVWIGNDETHYVRKFEDRDIEDMKLFMGVAVSWIDSELIAELAFQMAPRT